MHRTPRRRWRLLSIMLLNCGSPDCESKSAERLKAQLAEAAARERDAREEVQRLDSL